MGLTPVTGRTQSLLVKGEPSEITGKQNGAQVNPAINTAGLQGKVVVQGSGSINFTPAQVGEGVFFLTCCDNSANAYYRFAGTAVGNVFSTIQGQISFYLKSGYTFAQRATGAASPRVVFDVRDNDPNNHLFYFYTQGTSNRLSFNYAVGGGMQTYWVPAGTEDSLFGSGVILKVTITWDGKTTNLYLNGALVQSSSYAKSTPNWTASSNFDFGAYEYLSYGGFNSSDDVIDEFAVTGTPGSGPDTVPPVVSMTAPLGGATVSKTILVSANATDNVAVAGVQFQADGVNLGAMISGAGPSFSASWDTTTAANGPHTVSAVATDTAGNSATSTVSAIVTNTFQINERVQVVGTASVYDSPSG